MRVPKLEIFSKYVFWYFFSYSENPFWYKVIQLKYLVLYLTVETHCVCICKYIVVYADIL